MQIPQCPAIAPEMLPPEPAGAAATVSAMADGIETQLRDVLTEGVHPSACLAWLVKGPAAISLIQGPDVSSAAQNALVEEAVRSGIPVRALAEDIAQRYQRFLLMEVVVTGHRRRITLNLPGLLSASDLLPEAQIEGMCALFNEAMQALWAELAEVLTPWRKSKLDEVIAELIRELSKRELRNRFGVRLS